MSIHLTSNDVTKVFRSGRNNLRGFRHCSFSLCGGEILAVIGESGCGKTTLLNCIAGYFRCSANRVSVFRSLLPIRERSLGYYDGEVELFIDDSRVHVRNHTNYLPQGLGLFEHASIWSNLRIAALHETSISRDSAQALMREFRLPYDLDQSVNGLSAGERQRVALVRTLLNSQRRIVLLDEPFNGIDYATRRVIEHTLRARMQNTSSICIIVSHDIHEILPLASHVMLFEMQEDGVYATRLVEPRSILTAVSRESFGLLYGGNMLKAVVNGNGTVRTVGFASPSVRVVGSEEPSGNGQILEFRVTQINPLVPEMRIAFSRDDLATFIAKLTHTLPCDVVIQQEDIWVAGWSSYRQEIGNRGIAELIPDQIGYHNEKS